VVTRFLLCGLLGLLHLLRSFVELVQVLSGGQIPRDITLANDMMALGFVMGSWVFALGQMRLRRRLAGHGRGSFGLRMSIIGGSHACLLVRRVAALRLACEEEKLGGPAGLRSTLGLASCDLVVGDQRAVSLRWRRLQWIAMGVNGRWKRWRYCLPRWAQ
jgi:hypothetical protein